MHNKCWELGGVSCFQSSWEKRYNTQTVRVKEIICESSLNGSPREQWEKSAGAGVCGLNGGGTGAVGTARIAQRTMAVTAIGNGARTLVNGMSEHRYAPLQTPVLPLLSVRREESEKQEPRNVL